MKTAAIALIVAAAGVAAPAVASHETATTRMVYEVSTDGIGWSPSVSVAPSTPVAFRVRFEYTGASDVSRFVYCVYQPTFSNVLAGDTLRPFRQGTNTSVPPGALPDVPGMPAETSKVAPFAAVGQTATGAGLLTAFSYTASGTSFLRIAGANAPNQPGQGTGNNNVTGNYGVISAQQAQNTNPATSLDGTNVVVFKGSMLMSSATGARSITLSTPAEAICNVTDLGTGEIFKGAYWLQRGSSSVTGDIRTTVTVQGATINIIPAPGVVGLLAMTGLAGTRRRR